MRNKKYNSVNLIDSHNDYPTFKLLILYKYWLLMREMVKTISPRCSGDRYYFPAGRAEGPRENSSGLQNTEGQ